jgi:hypothetical protein
MREKSFQCRWKGSRWYERIRIFVNITISLDHQIWNKHHDFAGTMSFEVRHRNIYLVGSPRQLLDETHLL